MASRFGRCVNFGDCGKADARTNLPIAVGVTDATCPECGKPLSPAAAKASGPPVGVIVGGIVLVLLLLFGVSRLFTKGSTATVAISTAAPAASNRVSVPISLALCGSNTIGSQLGPNLVRGFLTTLGAGSPTAHGVGNDEQSIEGDVTGKTVKVQIAAHGSATAFTGLRSGSCQIGMSSRRIKSGEAATLHTLGNMLSPASEHVIGLDGIAVVVNASNPIPSLTVSQLKAVFTGQIRDWHEIGGGSGHIAVFARDDKSGTYDTLKALVLNEAPLVSGSRRFEDSVALSSAVSSNSNAIGFIGLPYVGQSKAIRIASGGAAIVPTMLTIGRETYPLTRRLFLYTAASPQNPLVSKFLKYVQSDAGQVIVNHEGFVGTVASLAATKSSSRNVPVNAPPRYRNLVDGYDQASFNFYFNTGSEVLDNKALVDVGRLVSLLSSSANSGKSIVLAGFADSTGDPTSNASLSLNRANTVSKELQAEGIRVKDTVGFGQELPIRDNATESGREKNRRVEIFITR